MSKEAMKLALEALELSSVTIDSFGVQEKTQEAITALRDALAEQPAQQEPVAWMLEWTFNGEERGYRLCDDGRHCIFDAESDGGVCRPLYTSPPAQRTWVRLTDEQFQAIKDSLFRQEGWDGEGWDLALKEAIEAKLMEKNT